MKTTFLKLVMILVIAILLTSPVPSSAIINGSTTIDYPYVGMIYSESVLATGTAIADGWVLTSAAVAQNVKEGMTAGGTYTFSTDEDTYSVSASYPHPSFDINNPSVNNVGLLRVDGLKQTFYPTLYDQNPDVGNSVMFVGYGATDISGTNLGVRNSGASTIGSVGTGWFETTGVAQGGPGDTGGPALYGTSYLAGVIGNEDESYTFTVCSSIAQSKAWVESIILQPVSIAFDTKTFSITKNKKSGSTTTSMSGTIPNLPALNLVNGGTVNAIITIQLSDAVAPGVDLIITSDQMTLEVTETNRTFTIRK